MFLKEEKGQQDARQPDTAQQLPVVMLKFLQEN
jgi:hypothetical protein